MHIRAVFACLLALVAALLSCTAAAAAPIELTVRIEGNDRTLFEGPIVTEGRAVQAFSDTRPRHCDGTNNGANPAPVATPTASAVDAMQIVGQDFDGDWYVGFDDYFITRWGSDGQIEAGFAYWGVLVNGRFTPVGGCQYADAAGDEVLWAYDAFNSQPFLRLAGAADPSPAPGPALPTATVGQGQPLALAVVQSTGAMDGSPANVKPAAGVQVAPVTTDPVTGYQLPNPANPATVTTAADGNTSIAFATAGWHRLKATAPGYVRSNRLDVCVLAPGASDCGPLPADARVRGAAQPEPDPDPPHDPAPPSSPPPAGATPVVEPPRSNGVDAQKDTTGRSLGLLTVPLDDRSRRLRYRGAWTRAADRSAWKGTVMRGSRGASVRVRLAAGKPVVFLRGATRGARIEIRTAGKRKRVRVATGARHRAAAAPHRARFAGAAPRTVIGARRLAGVVTVTILRGTVGLDGIAVAP
jgi:hypothetical protein